MGRCFIVGKAGLACRLALQEPEILDEARVRHGLSPHLLCGWRAQAHGAPVSIWRFYLMERVDGAVMGSATELDCGRGCSAADNQVRCRQAAPQRLVRR
eukprot:scaffold43478_cov63-Phaeocystis_antarctica.AAC.10